VRLTRPVGALLVAGSVAGCGVANPYTIHTRTHAQVTVSATTRASAAPVSTRSAAVLLRRYATVSINWTSHTLAARQRELARLAVAGARAQALQTAASYGPSSSLHRSRVSNRGQITSIATGQGPRRGWWVITTQETTSGSGDYQHLPAQAHVYAARLTRTGNGWQVSRWSPQS
jgi:hypothetical protein